MAFQNELLDEKDGQLLLALAKDCRAPLSTLSERVGLSVSSVSQRISKLEESGVIKNYKLVLNHKAFPLDEFDIYYKLADVSEFAVKNVMKHLNECPYTTQVLGTMGYADVRVTMFARNMQHLSKILEETERLFSSHIHSRTILAVSRKFKARPEVFLTAIFGEQAVARTVQQVYKETAAQLDSVDKRLITALAADPRASYASLAKLVELTPEAVSARVRGLEEHGIILGYQALIDGPRLGYRFAVLLLRLRYFSEQERKAITAVLSENKRVSSAVETIGDFTLSVTFFGKTLDELRETELAFRASFGAAVVKSALLFILENEKYPHLATGLLEDA